MRKHDRRGHQLWCLVARVAEHQSLIAGALLGRIFSFRRARVHALGNVRGLTGDDVLNVDLIGMENVVLIDVTDFANAIAHDLGDWQNALKRFVFGQARNGDLAADNDALRFGVGFTRHPAMSILPEAGIEHRVGDGIANLIRVTFPNRFGRKNVATRHTKK